MNEPDSIHGEAIKRRASLNQAEEEKKKKKEDLLLEDATEILDDSIEVENEGAEESVINRQVPEQSYQLANDLKAFESKIAEHTEALTRIVDEMEDEERLMINLLLQ